eukprot:gene24475-biopygen2913
MKINVFAWVFMGITVFGSFAIGILADPGLQLVSDPRASRADHLPSPPRGEVRTGFKAGFRGENKISPSLSGTVLTSPDNHKISQKLVQFIFQRRQCSSCLFPKPSAPHDETEHGAHGTARSPMGFSSCRRQP